MDDEEIVAWVAGHEQVLSADLAELSRYPIPFRKVIVGMMSPDARMAIRQEHLLSAASADFELSAEQQAFVLDSARMVPVLFRSGPSSDAMTTWKSRAVDLCTPAQRMRIFGTLGPPEPPEGLPLPADARPWGTA
jgi:hypothetical protein